MPARGTIELIGIELGNVLKPLEQRLQAGQVLVLLSELGLQFPPALLGNAALSNAFVQTGNEAGQLAPKITALIAAIDADNTGDILSKSADLLTSVINIITNIKTIADELEGVGPIGGISAGDVTAFAQKLPESLFGFLVIRYCETRFPIVGSIFEFVGLFEKEDIPADPVNLAKPAYTKRVVRFDRFPKLFTKPQELFTDIYKWGANDFDGKAFIPRIHSVLQAFAIPVTLQKASEGEIGPALRFGIFRLKPTNAINPPGLEALIFGEVASTLSVAIPLWNEAWKFGIDLEGSLSAGTGIRITPPHNISIIPPSGSVSGSAAFKLIGKPVNPPRPFILLGQAGGSRVEIGEVSNGITVSFDWDSGAGQAKGAIGFESSLKNGKIIIDSSKGDGLIQKILSGIKAEADFDILIGVSSDKGFYFQGSSALEIKLPIHVDIGPIALEGLTLTLKMEDGKFPVSLGTDIKASLGPLVAVVQNMGVTATFSFPPNNSGNMGPMQVDFGFKPPNGVGLSLDTGVIKGGGFLYLDFDKGEYFGSLELEFQSLFSLKAVGIINTKMPDGSQGFSLLIIITAEFTPIQLGFGFTLNAVGGLLGLNRTTKIDVLREGVKTNAIKSILFPEDVVANISRIVSDIKQVFPPYPDHFIIGPMAKIGWGTPSLITLELGILIEIPVPRIVILGVIKAVLPTEEAALLRLQVNFLGVIDFENKYISFDASLYDSRLLVFTLTGDMAFRLSWGDQPVFILSVGGFHPAFHEAPQDLQHMTRLTISLLSGDNPRISIQCYFAVTSNTVQLGAKAELYAEACGFNVYGYLGFDVLFQFDPFRFIAAVYAGLALRRGTSVIMGIRLSGELAGPEPWDVKGEASFTILFFDITVSFHETWGDNPDDAGKEKIDVIDLLTREIADNRNWKADIPDNNKLHVTIKEIKDIGDKLVIHPFGVLTFSERLVPLELDINKFGNKLPKDAKRFEIKTTDPSLKTQEVKEQFAPANFIDMKDNEKLARPSFENMKSGFKITGSSAVQTPMAVNKSVDYELSYLRKKRVLVFAGIYKYAKSLFKANVKGGAVAKSSLSFANNKVSSNAPEAINMKTEQFAVAGKNDMKLYSQEMTAGSYTEAVQLYNKLVEKNPALKDEVQVVSHYELNPN